MLVLAQKEAKNALPKNWIGGGGFVDISMPREIQCFLYAVFLLTMS